MGEEIFENSLYKGVAVELWVQIISTTWPRI